MAALEHVTVAFRTDASTQIGTGHVMRCLTLADALRERGAKCRFVSREHPGNLLDLVRERGHEALALPIDIRTSREPLTAHTGWLNGDVETDAQETRAALAESAVDWLIVDHYGIDARWERQLRAACRKLMVIDDLANRPHDCDLLLDQNLGRSIQDYAPLVPCNCTVLAGPKHALLRPEFASQRPYSLARRAKAELQHVLITMGGVDKDDATGQVLDALNETRFLPSNCRITVVMGQDASWLEKVRTKAAMLPWPVEVVVNARDMAKIMADSDLAIGAAGGTSWERCCLGLPAIIVALAENQRLGARALHEVGAALMLGDMDVIGEDLSQDFELKMAGLRLAEMAAVASTVTDGEGVGRVIATMVSRMSGLDATAGVVRRMTSADLEMVLSWRNHPEVRCHMYTQHEISMDEHQRWFELSSQDPRKHLLIYEVAGVPRGFINFTQTSQGGIAEWGFYVSPGTSKGSGRELGRTALQHAFGELQLHKVCGQALEENERSIGMHIALGFRQEGVLREQHFDGKRYHDIVCFGLLSREWLEVN